ncbi:hypothetical protein CsatB_002909 [Cannabis sativa]
MYFISMILENLTLSLDDNEDLIYYLKRRWMVSNRPPLYRRCTYVADALIKI